MSAPFDAFNFQDRIFLRAFDLGCNPKVHRTPGGFDWVCPCRGHEHADDPNACYFVTESGLDRLEMRRAFQMKEAK